MQVRNKKKKMTAKKDFKTMKKGGVNKSKLTPQIQRMREKKVLRVAPTLVV